MKETQHEFVVVNPHKPHKPYKPYKPHKTYSIKACVHCICPLKLKINKLKPADIMLDTVSHKATTFDAIATTHVFDLVNINAKNMNSECRAALRVVNRECMRFVSENTTKLSYNVRMMNAYKM